MGRVGGVNMAARSPRRVGDGAGECRVARDLYNRATEFAPAGPVRAPVNVAQRLGRKLSREFKPPLDFSSEGIPVCPSHRQRAERTVAPLGLECHHEPGSIFPVSGGVRTGTGMAGGSAYII